MPQFCGERPPVATTHSKLPMAMSAAFKMLAEDKYRAIFEENRRLYEAKYGEPWVPHKARG